MYYLWPSSSMNFWSFTIITSGYISLPHYSVLSAADVLIYNSNNYFDLLHAGNFSSQYVQKVASRLSPSVGCISQLLRNDIWRSYSLLSCFYIFGGKFFPKISFNKKKFQELFRYEIKVLVLFGFLQFCHKFEYWLYSVINSCSSWQSN